ncbi:hypothetical protein CGRA01v4_06354 [Colletotrichum graminicola]|nr:hypothetical protein CGRA01v4_06354 [Colletotrichum graminicola]
MGIPGNTAIRPAAGQFADAGTLFFFSFLFSYSLPRQGKVWLLFRPQGFGGDADGNGIWWVPALLRRNRLDPGSGTDGYTRDSIAPIVTLALCDVATPRGKFWGDKDPELGLLCYCLQLKIATG